MKKKLLYGLSFILPIVILLIVAGINGFMPFGNKLFNMFDSYTQYPAFMAELGNMLRQGRTLFYSFRLGMGVDFLGIIFLYLANPLNLLFAFFSKEKIFLFYTFMIYLKIGFCGLTMYIYLNGLDNKFKNTEVNLLFALIYALSGYAIAFSVHLMWMDAYILLPLIIKGLDDLILKNKSYFYIIFLALVIILNYYMAFKVCIFLVIYFVYKALLTNNLNKKKIIKFVLASSVAALLASVVLIPVMFNLMGGRFSSLTSFDWKYFNVYALLTIPFNLTIGAFVPTDNWSAGSTIIYSSIFVLVLIVYYFANKNIDKKKKILTLGVLVFFAISFSFLLIDYSWNMFQRPLGWSHRYQFVLVFLLILIAYDSLVNLNDLKLSKKFRTIAIFLFVVMVGLSFVYKYRASALILPNSFLLMVVLSMILFTIYINHMKFSKIMMGLVILELGVNINGVLLFSTVRYDDAVSRISKLDKKVQNISDIDDYRAVNLGGVVDYNLIAGYNSIEIFSSSHNIRTLNFIQKTGVSEHYMNTAEVDEVNPAVLSLLGLKYYITDTDLGYFNCENGICEDKYALPFMFGVNDTLKDVKIKDDYVENINNIYSALLGYDVKIMNYLDLNCVELVKMKMRDDGTLYEIDDDAKVNINYKATKKEMIIFNSGLMEIVSKKVFLNNEEIEVLENSKIILNEGDFIKISTDYSTAVENKLYIYIFSLLDLQVYEDAIKLLHSEADYQNIVDNNYILKGNVNTPFNTIMISIPYTEGLIIKIDGKSCDYFPVMETFVGVNVNSGKHTITVEYIPKGLISGAIISLFTVSIMSLKVIYVKRKSSRLGEFVK